MSLRSSSGGIRGWGCTPTGEPPAAAVIQDEPPRKSCLSVIFTRGWRRNALYGILVILVLLVFLNIALTLWIISAMRLSMDGVGPIKIVKGGIQLAGQAWILDRLVASSITSQMGQPITMHSHRNFSVLVSNPDRGDYSKFLMKRDSVEFSGRMFDVRDSRGGRVFHASRDEVRVFADTFTVDSAGGLTVQGAMQVPFVRAPPGSNLQLESLTRKLELRAPQSIFFESRAGSIEVTAHGNIKLGSTVGAIKIDSSNIIINNLKEAPTIDKPQRNVRNKVYQLCACATGKLFLASPDALCEASDDDTELCR